MFLYADEDFAFPIIAILRQHGHDIVTAQEDGRRATPDPIILSRAHTLGRAVLTHNRRHYERLHWQGMAHSGIVSVKQNPANHAGQAAYTAAALTGLSPGRWCVRVNRPPVKP